MFSIIAFESVKNTHRRSRAFHSLLVVAHIISKSIEADVVSGDKEEIENKRKKQHIF